MHPEREGYERAAQFRADHRLGSAPLADVVSLIDQVEDVDVSVLDAGPDEHGLTMRDPVRGVAFIAVARTRDPMRQRSSLAHELCHYLFGDSSPDGAPWDSRGPAEIRADAFARHLLAPVPGLREVLEGRGQVQDLSLADVSSLVQRFQASPKIILIQLAKAGLISPETKQSWWNQTTPTLAARYGWSDQYLLLQEQADTRRAPQRLLARAVAAYLAGVVPIETIARLRGLPAVTIRSEFDATGISPAPVAVPWGRVADLPAQQADLDFSDLDALDALDDLPAELPTPDEGQDRGEGPRIGHIE